MRYVRAGATQGGTWTVDMNVLCTQEVRYLQTRSKETLGFYMSQSLNQRDGQRRAWQPFTHFGTTLIYSTTRDTRMSNVESRMKKHGTARANFAKQFVCHFQASFRYFFLFSQFLKTILRLNLFHSMGFVSNHKAKTLRDVMQVVSYHIMYSFHDTPHRYMQTFYHVVWF